MGQLGGSEFQLSLKNYKFKSTKVDEQVKLQTLSGWKNDGLFWCKNQELLRAKMLAFYEKQDCFYHILGIEK